MLPRIPSRAWQPGISSPRRIAAGHRSVAELQLPGAIRCCAAAFSASSSVSSCADPRCSISRDPRREDHTTRTAVAPDAVFTVRMRGAEMAGARG